MNSVSLDELKGIEKNIKRQLITEYNEFISEEKASLLLNEDYFNKSNYSNNKSLSKYQGELLRKLFSELINVKVEDNIESENLQEGLVEYYTKEFANKNNLEINERPDLKNKIKNAKEMINKLGEKSNKLIFTSNFNDINSIISETDVEDKNKDIIPSLVLVYENNEQFIKYIDNNGEIHLVKSNDPKKVSKLYKKLSNKNTNPKEMFEELTSIENNIKNKEIDMLDFIQTKNNSAERIDINEDVINDVISNITDNENINNSNLNLDNNEENDNLDTLKEDNDESNAVLEVIEEDNNEPNLNNIVNEDLSEEDDESNAVLEVIEEDNNKPNLNNIVNEDLSEDDDESNAVLEVIEEDNNKPNPNNIIQEKSEDLEKEYNNETLYNNNINEENSFLENNDTNNYYEENKKNDLYMLFYIIAIVICVALIIGFVIYNFYN